MSESNLDELRRQWRELKAQKKAGHLDTEAHAAARAALERRIVAAVLGGGDAAADAANASPIVAPSATPAAPPPARASLRFWAVAVPFALVLAVVGYGWKGNPGAVGSPPPGFTQAGGGGTRAPQRTGDEQIGALVTQLQERLDKQPGDVEGWSLLARSQMTLGRHDEAAAAYRKALAIKPDDAALLTDYADALGVLSGRTLEGEPARLLERALKLDPRHVKALVLVGTLEFQRGNYAAAQKRWQEVVAIGPAGDGLVELAREGVAQAERRQARADASPAPAARPAPPAAQGSPASAASPSAAGLSISGTVRLAAALKARASPDDVVFIFARAAGGGGMPLAIVRKRVADLPATFTLDDSQAMSPAARLSSAPQVVVMARVSKTGQATPQAGDLEGSSAPVAPGSPGAGGLLVEISSVRR